MPVFQPFYEMKLKTSKFSYNSNDIYYTYFLTLARNSLHPKKMYFTISFLKRDYFILQQRPKIKEDSAKKEKIPNWR